MIMHLLASRPQFAISLSIHTQFSEYASKSLHTSKRPDVDFRNAAATNASSLHSDFNRLNLNMTSSGTPVNASSYKMFK
jgi:hypothetical protein